MSSLTEKCIYSLTPEEFLTVAQKLGDSNLFTWELCRKKAKKDFAIPRDYFDLPLEKEETLDRRKEPLFRYLEILTKFRLTPFSLYNIFEPLGGVYESLSRNDDKMVLYFASFLTEKEKESFLNDYLYLRPSFILVSVFHTKALRKLLIYLNSPQHNIPSWAIYVEDNQSIPEGLTDTERRLVLRYLLTQGKREYMEEAKEYLNSKEIYLSVLSSGSLTLLEEVLYLNKELGLQEINSLQEISPLTYNIKLTYSYFPFSAAHSSFTQAAVKGGQPEIVNFFRKYSSSYCHISESKADPVKLYIIARMVKINGRTSDLDIIRSCDAFSISPIIDNPGNIIICQEISNLIRKKLTDALSRSLPSRE